MSDTDLSYMERFYMALADKTRLRLLNLMRRNEVCVCFFTEVLGESQPKISRHLAYLRNAGIVAARRDGKWMHYSIVWPEDEGARQTLEAALDWLGGREEMQIDVQNYETVCCTPELLVQIARTPIDFLEAIDSGVYALEAEPVKARTVDIAEFDDSFTEDESDRPYESQRSHNELEEFLL
jgi:ArsR family transcriptional regulator, arsenate/arsenite/antimonite-responsive transcriptional repressor